MKWKYLSVCVLPLMTTYAVASVQSYGHRGARGLSPENTIPAYHTAMAIGVDFIDMDIGLTKDGVVVVTHNEALNPDITKQANGQWVSNNHTYIKDLTFAQLQRYDVGQIKPGTEYAKLFANQWPVPKTHIPSLAQVIDYADAVSNHRIRYQIEMKTDPTEPNATFSPDKIAKALATVMQEKGIVDRAEVQAFDYRCLIALQKINPKIKTAYLTQNDEDAHGLYDKDPKKAAVWSAGHTLNEYGGSIPKMVKALGGSCWDPQDTMLTKKDLDEAHRLGLRVVVWHWVKKQSPPDVAMIEKLLGWGVDGIITDRPDILRGLMAARNRSEAPAYFKA